MNESEAYLDTNIFLRFLAADHPTMSPESARLIERAEAGEITLRTSHLTLAEIVWSLRSQYQRSREDVAATLSSLLGLHSLRVDQPDFLREVTDWYRSTNVDFTDAYNALDARRRGFDRIVSYDRDFDRLPIERTEPGDLVA